MSKIIFFTDLHTGVDLPARYEGDISIYGEQWGLPLLYGMISHAEKTPDATFIHGGDELTITPEMIISHRDIPIPEQQAARQRYADVDKNISHANLYSRVKLHRTIGNHDVLRGYLRSGLNPCSHIFTATAMPNTDVLICQPKLDTGGRGITFFYDPDEIIDLIKGSSADNLVISAHWAWDREKRRIVEREALYQDNTGKIRTYLEQKIGQGKLHSAITLHGHSHLFSMSGRPNFSTISMPSICQNDADIDDIPCGLFTEITVGEKTGKLGVAFKRILLGDKTGEKFVVQDVSTEEIMAYKRGKTTIGTATSPRQRGVPLP